MLTGTDIRNLRKERNLTQKQLGELTGIHQYSIARWESAGKDKPIGLPYEYLIKQVLGV
jgi:transcriptional regulator with XRE-family HTH domain